MVLYYWHVLYTVILGSPTFGLLGWQDDSGGLGVWLALEYVSVVL